MAGVMAISSNVSGSNLDTDSDDLSGDDGPNALTRSLLQSSVEVHVVPSSRHPLSQSVSPPPTSPYLNPSLNLQDQPQYSPSSSIKCTPLLAPVPSSQSSRLLPDPCTTSPTIGAHSNSAFVLDEDHFLFGEPTARYQDNVRDSIQSTGTVIAVDDRQDLSIVCVDPSSEGHCGRGNAVV